MKCSKWPPEAVKQSHNQLHIKITNVSENLKLEQTEFKKCLFANLFLDSGY
jgi:hypothetical protein